MGFDKYNIAELATSVTLGSTVTLDAGSSKSRLTGDSDGSTACPSGTVTADGSGNYIFSITLDFGQNVNVDDVGIFSYKNPSDFQ